MLSEMVDRSGDWTPQEALRESEAAAIKAPSRNGNPPRLQKNYILFKYDTY